MTNLTNRQAIIVSLTIATVWIAFITVISAGPEPLVDQWYDAGMNRLERALTGTSQ